MRVTRLLMSGFVLGAGCRVSDFRPADPFVPLVSPSLSGCVWHETWVQEPPVPAGRMAAHDRVRVYDADGRPVRETEVTTYAEGDSSSLERRWTWRGTCLERLDLHTEVAGRVDDLFTTTRCDASGSPVETDAPAKLISAPRPGVAHPRQVLGYENAYDDEGRLITAVETKDGAPTGLVRTYRWDEDRLLGVREESNGALVRERQYGWRRDLLVEDVDLLSGPSPYETRVTHLYRGGRWLGSDQSFVSSAETRESTLRWTYEGGDHPTGQSQTEGTRTSEHEIRVTCDQG